MADSIAREEQKKLRKLMQNIAIPTITESCQNIIFRTTYQWLYKNSFNDNYI